MAHLQSRPAPQPQRIRLTSVRGFMANPERLTGRQVKAIWQARFGERGPGHRFWLYTHIPFCPQICSFCQCSTSLRKSDRQVETYLDWLEGEIDFFADVSASGVVQFQYVGGGTPNILTEPQLERLLGHLNRQFRFAPGSRRTFEFLPSSLREDTLALVRTQGFTRLSCGVQSWSPETLKAVNRSQGGLDALGRTIQSAYDLGFDEFNVDLVHGIGAESAQQFLDGLLAVLALRPTTVTLHHVIPTATNPVFASVDEELTAHGTFIGLQRQIGEAVARQFPDIEWVLRPNSWILVDRTFHRGPNFSLWYFSDNERIHIDMLSFGRFAHSNLLGALTYENLSNAARYDPDEASYNAFRKSPAIDAALDLITDLVGDAHSDPAPIRTRYGEEGWRPLLPALERLRDDGIVRERHGSWEPVATDGVFIDPFLPVLEAALQGTPPPWAQPTGKQAEQGVRIGSGDRALMVFVEKAVAGRRYFAEVGRLGLYYRRASGQSEAGDRWVDELMRDFIGEVRQLLEQAPMLSARQVTAQLQRRLQGA
jgi:coproporphyrinogen III oxidase-like Fe-S oxidoreductase